MTEPQRISKLFEDLYNGHPWLDVTLYDTLKPVSAELAAKKLQPDMNSIWEITVHLINWRKTSLLRLLSGRVIHSPENNFFQPVQDTSDSAWQLTLENLKITQQEWLNALEELSEEKLEAIYPGNKTTYYDNVHGIIQHDAYHLGQIVLLAKHTH